MTGLQGIESASLAEYDKAIHGSLHLDELLDHSVESLAQQGLGERVAPEGLGVSRTLSGKNKFGAIKCSSLSL